MIEPHALAELVPPMSEKEYEGFREDIRENGLSLAITTYEGKILDGRTRQRACEEAGVEPRYEPLDGDDPVAFVLSRNLHRRHLTITQRAMLADKLLPHFEEKAKERMLTGAQRGGQSKGSAPAPYPSKPSGSTAAANAAQAVGISARTLTSYERVKNHRPDLLPEVQAGEVAIKTAEKLIGQPASKPKKKRPTYDMDSGKGRQVAKGAWERMERVTGSLESTAKAFDENVIRIDLALAVAKDGEAERWIKTLKSSARSVRAFANHIEDRRNHGT